MSLDIWSHCRQLVGCQMPNFFSRIAGRSPRASTDFRKLLAIVSATVSTAGLAMLASSVARPLRLPPVGGLAAEAGWNLASTHSQSQVLPLAKFLLKSGPSAPGFLLFPAPFAARALFLG